jgi:hypothetical protein
MGSVTMRKASPAEAAAERLRKERRDANAVLDFDVRQISRSFPAAAITHLTPPSYPKQNEKTVSKPLLIPNDR